MSNYKARLFQCPHRQRQIFTPQQKINVLRKSEQRRRDSLMDAMALTQLTNQFARLSGQGSDGFKVARGDLIGLDQP